MARVEYQHIGHDPSQCGVALWSVDDRGQLHEERKAAHQPTVDWLLWSHDRVFRDVKSRATGRVELGGRAGSIHIADPAFASSTARLGRLLSVLEARYPETRWYLFGGGYRGEPVSALFEERAAA
jgi:hypothetical protein